ncbi:TolC family protein [Paraburkholderia eburnea]|uniref:TolC family protein n=1 Tax=Paraburkholderia eburnea TaxID=1189126 RepID=UPI00142D63D1|nr:TolC family protein [Paraburkholderia eburnea]
MLQFIALGCGCSVVARAEDLRDLYESAVGFDPQVKSAEAQLRAQEMKEPEARSRWLPAVKLSGSDMHGHVDQEDSVVPNYETKGYTLGVTQTVFDWGALQDLSESEILVEQAAIAYAESQSDLILRLGMAYFNALSAQEELAAAKRHVSALVAQEQYVEQNYNYGNGTVVDVREAEATLDSARADEVERENDVQVKLAQLSSIVGRRPQILVPLSPTVPILLAEHNSVDEWMQIAMEQSNQVRIQALEVARADTEVKKARYSNLPVVTAVASYGRGNANYINGQNNYITGGHSAAVAEIGVQVTIPLFDGMLSRSQRMEHEALEDKARFDLDAVKQQAALGAQQAYLNVQGGISRISALRTAQGSARESLNYNMKAYRAGVRLNSDVLAAADKLYQQETQLSEARLTTLSWILRLKNVAGDLTVSEVDSVNALLGPSN